MSADELKETESRDDFRGARSSGESGGDSTPQFLIEADDLYDDEYGEGRLVAPPVLGEAPQSYRDF